MSDPCRPQTFDDVVAQHRAKRTVQILVRAAINQDKPIAHTILLGSPGLGKSTLAKLMAQERRVGVIETIGSAIATPEDLTRLLLRLKPNWVLVIDEIHRMPVAVEEQLYPAIDELKVANAGCVERPSAFMRSLGIAGKSEQETMVDIAPFTLVACSTLSGMISPPLRSRCQLIQLSLYSPAELQEIVTNASRRMGFPIGDEAAGEVARRSRSSARNAVQNLKWLNEFCAAEGVAPTLSAVETAFELRQIDRNGLTLLDHELLRILRTSRGAVGLQTLAVRLGESEDTLERTVEPYLMARNYLERTAKGRTLGSAAGEVMERVA